MPWGPKGIVCLWPLLPPLLIQVCFQSAELLLMLKHGDEAASCCPLSFNTSLFYHTHSGKTTEDTVVTLEARLQCCSVFCYARL